ncbi:YraN family protein [Brevundimonas sp.]|uniref:YraN family protein n=1 Tax=Brevundimonas sp. TaxID=1871086 RepID=UPI0028964193|nr:YraN family protein [Brevundimonas sp.]
MKPRLRPSPSPRRPKSGWRQALGGRSHREGHAAEWIAAVWLMLKGYQILAFRLKGRGGEIDILAKRGRILAVVEVKRRRSIEAAILALGPEQHGRLAAAGRAVVHSRPSLQGLMLRIDMVALAPRRFPRHLRGVTTTGTDMA